MEEDIHEKSTKLFALLLTFVLSVTMVCSTNVSAAKKVQLNKTKVSVKVGKKVKLKVKNTKKKVKWSSKNKKIAKVSKKGVVTGKKAGKTYIIAKVGKKTYKCKVTVKKNTKKPAKKPETKPVETQPAETKPQETPTVPEETTEDPAIDNLEYSITGDNIIITGHKNQSADIVIPDKIDGKPVTSIAEKAFQESYSSAVRITSVSMPGSIRIIGAHAFSNCQQLKVFTIRGEGLLSIGDNAFNSCNKLEEFKVPRTVVSIGQNPFSNCEKMNLIFEEGVTTIPNLTYATIAKLTIPSTITNAGDVYLEGSHVTEVIINANITTLVDGAFADCNKLTKITIPETVTSIGTYTFNGCESLTTIIGVKGSYAETYAIEKGYTFVEK